MNIYVASSRRNTQQPEVVRRLREAGHVVYDFKNPPARAGFGWEQINAAWKNWTTQEYLAALRHPLAVAGFNADFEAMQRADVCVMVQPCGRSAAIEAGWCVGAGKPLLVLLAEGSEPELMFKMATRLCTSLDEVVIALRAL